MTIEERLQYLYDAEINCSISWFWDGGFDVKLGDPLNGFTAEGCCGTIEQCVDFLEREATKQYEGFKV